MLSGIGVRGGGRGAAAPPVLKICRASASCSKILIDKKCMFNTVKNIRAPSVFQGKRRLLKTSE